MTDTLATVIAGPGRGNTPQQPTVADLGARTQPDRVQPLPGQPHVGGEDLRYAGHGQEGADAAGRHP
jgi:hypothetical protein